MNRNSLDNGLLSPVRLAIAAVPIIGFLLTPFLSHIDGDHLWFGLPSVLVWSAICTVGTVVALRVTEASYLRGGGADADAADLAEAESADNESGAH